MKKDTLVIGILLIISVVALVYVLFFLEEKEQLIGGCAGVASEYTQECCDNWAEENNVIKIQCEGAWEIKDNKCSWKCGEIISCNTNSDCPPIVCVRAPCPQYDCVVNRCIIGESNKEFCGSSTLASCSDDSDCKIGGCSSQVCQGKNEEGIITTCEYRECYNSENYGAVCVCDEDKCKWSFLTRN